MRRPLATFVLAASVSFLWVLAVPLFAQPDERAHAIRADAAARGGLIATDLTPTQVLRFETEMEGMKRPTSSSLVIVRSSEALASSEY